MFWEGLFGAEVREGKLVLVVFCRRAQIVVAYLRGHGSEDVTSSEGFYFPFEKLEVTSCLQTGHVNTEFIMLTLLEGLWLVGSRR